MLARFRWFPLSLLVTFGLLALLAVACTQASSPIRAKLEMEGKPALGEPFTLTLVLDRHANYPMPIDNVHAGINVPDGIEVLSGATDWQLARLENDKEYTFSTSIRAMRNGYFMIPGFAQMPSEPSTAVDYLHIIVEGDDTWVSKSPPESTWKPSGSGGAILNRPELIISTLALSDQIAADRTVDVIFTVTPQIDLTNVEVGFTGVEGGVQLDNPVVISTGENTMVLYVLPDTVRVPPKNTRWAGSMRQGQTYEFRMTLHVTDNGQSELYAWVDERDPGDGHTLVATVEKLDLQYYIPRWAQ